MKVCGCDAKHAYVGLGYLRPDLGWWWWWVHHCSRECQRPGGATSSGQAVPPVQGAPKVHIARGVALLPTRCFCPGAILQGFYLNLQACESANTRRNIYLSNFPIMQILAELHVPKYAQNQMPLNRSNRMNKIPKNHISAFMAEYWIEMKPKLCAELTGWNEMMSACVLVPFSQCCDCKTERPLLLGPRFPCRSLQINHSDHEYQLEA